MPDDNPVEILVVAAPMQAEGAKGLFGTEPALIRLSQDTLKQNMARFLESVKGLLSAMPAAGGLHIEEIEIKVEINAEGGILLIGAATAGVTGGITLRVKP